MADLPRAELDRLLEASAAALGLELTWHTGICKGGAYRSPFITVDGQLVPWHPHQNSDQALMLLAAQGHMPDAAAVRWHILMSNGSGCPQGSLPPGAR